MKRVVYLLALFFFVYLFLSINTQGILASSSKEVLFDVSNPNQVCDSVLNGIVKIGIDSYYENQSVVLSPLSGKCNNFNDPAIVNVLEGDTYSSWVRFGLNDAKYNYYYDDVVLPKEEKRYFFINNRSLEYSSTTHKINQQATLKPGENIFIEVDLNNISVDSLNDLRLTLNYALVSSDKNLSLYNSIAYYVYTNDDVKYGPYKLDESIFINRNYYGTDSPNTRVNEYQVISENLISNIPKDKIINKIKFVPYEFFPLHGGTFRFYSIDVSNFKNGYTNNKEYINVESSESKLRHNIVNNMISTATLKWDVTSQNTTQMSFYSHIGTNNPKVYNVNSGNIYYGLPYVNDIDSTVNSFLSKTVINSDGYYSYNIADEYLESTQSTKYKMENPDSDELNIIKGSTIGSNLYVYEPYDTNDKKTTRKKNLEQNAFVSNDPGYLFGQDCSSSTFYAAGNELPYSDSLAGSRRYYHSNQLKILGDITFSYKDLEDFLRENNILTSDSQTTISLYDNYYSSFIKMNNNQQNIYNGYSLLIPGDFVSKSGHIRMISGYSHVVCNDDIFTDNYSEGYCNNHGGINPDLSYVIVTEIGASKYLNHVNSADTGWDITLSNLTDINSIDYLWGYTKEVDNEGKETITYNVNPSLRSFNINGKYTYSELYGEDNSSDGEIDSDPGMYIPFRYVEMDKVKTNKIEKPNARIILDKEYDDVNEVLSNYVKDNKKLKGILSTNYMIKGIKIDINNQKYYIYPNQTNKFSLYTDIEDENVINAIANVDYNNDYLIKVSLDYGPNIEEVKNAIGVDSEGYSEVLRLVYQKEDDQITVHEEEVEYDGNIHEANITSLSSISSIDYYSDNSCTNKQDPINAGKYYVKVTTSGNDHYNPITSECLKAVTINKKQSVMSITDTNVNISRYSNNFINYTYDGEGDVICENNIPSVVECIVNQNDKKITLVQKMEGFGEIKIKAQASTNYLESNEKVISVKVEYLKYDVSFETNGGNNIPKQSIVEGEYAVIPANPIKDGYVFKEWQLNGKEYTFNDPITSSITLTALYNQTLVSILSNNNYNVTDNYVSKFTLGKTIAEIRNQLGSDVIIESNTNIISTGTTIKKGNEIFNVVIKGDLTGDGKVNSGDLLQMRKHLLEDNILTGAYKKAGLIESTSEIKSLDLLRLRQYLLDEYTFKEN